jgi:hypothetical protein
MSRGLRFARLVGAGAALFGVAGMAAWAVVSLLTPTPAGRTSHATAVVQPHATAVDQLGRIVAVSDSSVTALGADGVLRTFVMTPDTTTVTRQGGHSGAAASTFAVNDQVSIVGEVRNGTAVATAVAEQSVANLDGPPMDYPAA